MKKILAFLAIIFIVPLLTACELSNTDIANSLEGNMTRLVYSVGYLDSISTEELSNLVNNSSYFTHSSLYTNTANSTTTLETTTSPTTNSINSALDGGLSSNSLTLNAITNPYRSRTYTSPIINNASVNNDNSLTANIGIVDMSLLETCSADLNNILLEISSKRGIIMLYCTDLRSGRATLSATDKKAIHEYDNIIQETTNYLNNTTGALLNQFNGILSISTAENNGELINAKLIRANEVLKTRYAKLDTCLDSMDAIINILVNNIGFEYASMYNNQIGGTTNSTTNSTTLNNSTANINSTDIISENETLTNNTNPCCQTCNQSPCICNNNSNYCKTCNQSPCVCNNSTCSTPTANTTQTTNNCQTNCTNNNVNSPNNLSPNASTYPINRPTNTPTTTSSLNSLQNEEEVVLNGGLIKNSNTEKINDSNANNFIIDKDTTLNAGSLTKDHKTDPKLGSYTYPFKTLEETNHNFPITNDLRDDEFIESEKELTPDLLPFSGVNESKNFDIQNLQTSRLGLINILPFQYEEEDVLKKIPRQ